jgi:hypothetical protein
MNLNYFQDNLGIIKYMWIFYYLMCPKTRQAHLNLYKSNNIPIPEYLDENKLMNYININRDELIKLTQNINKKYINQKYLEFINKVLNIEHFNSKSQINNYYYIIIILILLLIICGIFHRFF